jgi:hypothetical protein
VVRAIVLDALGKRSGDTLTKNSDFREALGVGIGTVQRALDLLADRGALRTVSRGHLGRRIESVDLGQCWQAAGLPPIRVSLSPPGSVEVDSLEAWLSDELVRLGVPHTMRHVRGGNQRLEQLRSGVFDLTVVSAGTFSALVDTWASPDVVMSRLLGPGTYYSPERLVVLTTDASRELEGMQRIAIDRESFDHEALTLAQFPPSPHREYIDVPFPEVPSFVLAGLADAGIWHVISSAVPLSLTQLKTHQMVGAWAIATRDRLSYATVTVPAGRPELRSVLDAVRLESLTVARDATIAADQAVTARLNRELAARRAHV